MTATFRNLNIIYNNGEPKFSPAAGKTELANKGDSVRINLSGFTGGDLNKGVISQINIYKNQQGANGEDEKSNTLEGSWIREGDQNSSTAFHIGYAHNKDNSLTYYFISDFEGDLSEDHKYWFGVNITSDEGTFSVDPELVNKKKG